MTPRELLMKFFDAINRHDVDRAMALIHPDFTDTFPQSGETIRGPVNLRGMIENYPGGVGEALDTPAYYGRDDEWAIAPNFTVIRVTDAHDTGTGVVRLRYGDGSVWWMILLFEVKDDLLYRQTTFFAEPFEAPEWRAPFAERIAD
jgi:hypothetical protein